MLFLEYSIFSSFTSHPRWPRCSLAKLPFLAISIFTFLFAYFSTVYLNYVSLPLVFLGSEITFRQFSISSVDSTYYFIFSSQYSKILWMPTSVPILYVASTSLMSCSTGFLPRLGSEVLGSATLGNSLPLLPRPLPHAGLGIASLF